MVVIFGWGAGEAEDLGEVAPGVCPNCHNHVFLHHIKSEKRISLYFVPLIPYGSNEYLACPTCHQGIQFSAAQRGEVLAMHSLTQRHRTGAYPPELYQQQVDRFWRTLGIAPSGAQVVRPAAAAPPPATAAPPPATPARPAVPTSTPTPAPAVVPEAQQPPQPAAAREPSLEDRLIELARLHARGILTDDEFAAAKRHLLGI